jgi:hypothetical protein
VALMPQADHSPSPPLTTFQILTLNDGNHVLQWENQNLRMQVAVTPADLAALGREITAVLFERGQS